ncbi:MAG: hypothetical protein IJB45_07085 [Clostridia bacterium]|nr:hypothetical protein [Clostridia bacterium]
MSSYIPIIFLWIIIFIILRSEKNQNIRRIIKKRKKRGITDMNDIFMRYVGKDCLVYVSNTSSSVLECNVTSVNENWLSVKTKDGDEIINIDYIIRIKEHPVNKNGKKKSVIF